MKHVVGCKLKREGESQQGHHIRAMHQVASSAYKHTVFLVVLLYHRPHFSLNIKTKSSKGLIFHVAGRGDIPLLALYMANGKIKMSLGHSRIIHHKEKSNDGQWHKVSGTSLDDGIMVKHNS